MNRDFLIWLTIAGLLIATTGTGVYIMARGIRNNNPGNIRHGDNWQGMKPIQTDKSFIEFVSPEYGIRAMARVLRNYQARHGLNTVEEIISRWAPPTENITGAYVRNVANIIGVDPRQEIFVDDYLESLIPAIIKHENGTQPYSMDQISEGIRLA